MVTSQEESCHYDRATIWIDQYYVTSIGLCSAKNVHAWLRSKIDLRDFAGQIVVFAIEVETDASLYSSVFVGDLSFESGVLIPTPGATATPTPTSIPATPVPTATSVPAGEEIRNPGFELGDNGDWESSPLSGASNIFPNDGAHSGSWLAWLGGAHNEVGYIEQSFYIPADRPYLTYWGWISTEESNCGADHAMFLAGSTELYGYDLCTPYNSAGWGQGWVNLAAYAGTTQTIRIQVQTDGILLSSLYLDDFSLAALPPSSSSSTTIDPQAAGAHGLPGATGLAPSDVQPLAREPESKEAGR